MTKNSRWVLSALLMIIGLLAIVIAREWMQPAQESAAEMPAPPVAPPVITTRVISSPTVSAAIPAIADVQPQSLQPLQPPADPERPSEQYLHSRRDDGQHAE